MNDPIGDMLTRIRNAQMRGKSVVSAGIEIAMLGTRCIKRRGLHPWVRKKLRGR